MERNQQYALYDGEAGDPQRWVAHVRLTPELLQRLQQRPTSVAIQLQAPGGGSGTTRAGSSTKLNSVLTIEDGSDADEPAVEKYEMLSFVEDAKNNAVCAFRADRDEAKGNDNGEPGYDLYQVGRVFQKLIVQRMLDSTEKDRMKDRHAKSVLESKARASKFVAADETSKPRTTRGKKMLATRGIALTHPPGHPLSKVVKRGAPTESVATPIKKRKLRSALSEETVQELQERIARGRESATEEELDTDAKDASSSQAPAKSAIFSSDSEVDKSPTRAHRVVEPSAQADSKPSGKNEAPPKKAAKKATTPKAQAKKNTTTSTTAKPDAKDPDWIAQAKPSQCASNRAVNAKTVGAIEEYAVTVPAPAETMPATPAAIRKAVDQDLADTLSSALAPLAKLPPVKGSKTETKKRARPRLSRLPDISFLPPTIQEICKRVSAHITRTAILDATDYDSFVAEHDRLRAEWEALDKAYSIETILIDGAHFQLPFATTDQEQQTLRHTIHEAEKKREGLLFVRDSMATIHKLLASLQASISAYEQKTLTTAIARDQA